MHIINVEEVDPKRPIVVLQPFQYISKTKVSILDNPHFHKDDFERNIASEMDSYWERKCM